MYLSLWLMQKMAVTDNRGTTYYPVIGTDGEVTRYGLLDEAQEAWLAYEGE